MSLSHRSASSKLWQFSHVPGRDPPRACLLASFDSGLRKDRSSTQNVSKQIDITDDLHLILHLSFSSWSSFFFLDLFAPISFSSFSSHLHTHTSLAMLEMHPSSNIKWSLQQISACFFFTHFGPDCIVPGVQFCSVLGFKESVILCATLMSCSPYPPHHHAFCTWDLIFAAKLQFFFFFALQQCHSLSLDGLRNPQTIKPLQMNPSSMDLLLVFHPFHLRLHLSGFV